MTVREIALRTLPAPHGGLSELEIVGGRTLGSGSHELVIGAGRTPRSERRNAALKPNLACYLSGERALLANIVARPAALR
jgi:hypothetical protein